MPLLQPKSIDTTENNKIDRFSELKEKGWQNLDAEERKEYSELKGKDENQEEKVIPTIKQEALEKSDKVIDKLTKIEHPIEAQIMVKQVKKVFVMTRNVLHNNQSFVENDQFDSVPQEFIDKGYAEEKEVVL